MPRIVLAFALLAAVVAAVLAFDAEGVRSAVGWLAVSIGLTIGAKL